MSNHPDMPFDETSQPASIEETLESISESLKEMIEQNNRVIEMYDREHEILIEMLTNAREQQDKMLDNLGLSASLVRDMALKDITFDQ